MTDRKPYKPSQKPTTLTASKTAVDSSHKKTALKQRLPETNQSNRKNLMAEFERVEAETKAKENISKLQSQAMSSINESSISSSQLVEEIGRSITFREEDYAFQLPRSYIIAMSGLQQAIVQRDSEIKRVVSEYEEERNIRAQLENINRENALKIKQNDLKIGELTTQIKILKQNAVEDRRTFAQIQRNRIQLQNQLALSKQTNAIQSDSQEKMLLQLRTELEKVQQEYLQFKNENIQLRQAAEAARKDFQKLKSSQEEQREKEESQVKEMVEELKRQRERRKRAEQQIVILKKQAQLLAQRTINAQHQQHQALIQEVIIRKPLLDIPTFVNQDRRESLSRKSYHRQGDQYAEKKTQPDKLSQEVDKKIEMLSSASKGAHHRKATDGSLLSRERSSSRVRPRQNCPELVSQYRELMRHQKELIGLNYQLQLLEKGMARQGEDKGELLKNYQKLRRQCQQKQMQIRELKSFLNDPVK